MQHLALEQFGLAACFVEGVADVVLAHLVAGDLHLHMDRFRVREAAGDVDEGAADGLARHALGGIGGGADRGFHGLDVDDRATAHALGDLVSDALDLDAAVIVHAGDEATNLRRPDVERCDQPTFTRRHALCLL